MLRRPTSPPGPRFSHATGDARHGLDEFNPILFFALILDSKSAPIGGCCALFSCLAVDDLGLVALLEPYMVLEPWFLHCCYPSL